MVVVDVPILVYWIGVAAVGLLASWIGNKALKSVAEDEPPRHRKEPSRLTPPVRQLISAALGVIVGASSVFVFPRDSSSPPADDPLEVLVVWNGSELSAFLEVVSLYGSDVQVESAGPAIADRLDELFADGDPPDVAIIPQPSVVRRYAALGRIEPIEDEVTSRIPEAWNRFALGQHGRGLEDEYGVFVKGAYKSLFWYHPAAFPDEASTPETWSWPLFADWIRRGGDEPSFAAPLTLPVANQWPLTDWFENHLAALDPGLYDALADGTTTDWDQQPVRAALGQIADLWQNAEIFYGGPEAVSDIELEDLTRELADRNAAVMFAPSFAAAAVSRMDAEDQARPFGYPRLEGRQPQVVGGDIAVVTSGATEGHRFVRWLTDQEAMAAWADEDRGFLTPNLQSPYRSDAHPRPEPDDAVHVLLTHFLQSPAVGDLHFDLSDEFGGVNEGRPCIVWKIFSDFFAAVTAPDATEAAVAAAIDEVVENLNAEVRGLETDVTCGGST